MPTAAMVSASLGSRAMLSPKLRHLVPALVAGVALALTGCGGDSGASSPLDEALGYLPEDAGFAFIADTDPDAYSDFQDLAEKFPFASRATDFLKQALERGSIDFDEQIRPLLGNEVVIGTSDNASFLDNSDDTPFVLALETEDADKLRELAEDSGDKTGENEGYDQYESDDGTVLAIKDDVLVLSNDERTLEAALRQRGEDDRLTEDDVDPTFEDLTDEGPIRAYVNVRSLLAASPQAKDALKVEWVDHIDTFGLSADADDEQFAIDWSLRTDSEGLTDDDLPIASGSEAPQVLERDEGSAEVVLGLRDPSQLIDFGLAAAKVVDPAGFAEFESGKAAIGRQLGVDVDKDVLAQLTGNVAAVVTIDGDFGLRSELEDSAAFEDTLAKVMDGLPDFADGVTVVKPKGSDFYGVSDEKGDSFVVGIAEGALIVANTAKLADEVASRGLVDADGAEGAFVASADAEQLANAAIAKTRGALPAIGGSLLTGPLGELLESVSASTGGLKGHLELNID
jgi:hypothetical protein